jgi:hypothetical protein
VAHSSCWHSGLSSCVSCGASTATSAGQLSGSRELQANAGTIQSTMAVHPMLAPLFMQSHVGLRILSLLSPLKIHATPGSHTFITQYHTVKVTIWILPIPIQCLTFRSCNDCTQLLASVGATYIDLPLHSLYNNSFYSFLQPLYH